MRPAVDLAGQPQQPLAGAVDGDLLGGDFRAIEREALGERRAQILRQRGHGVEALRAAHVQPLPNLLHAHALLLWRHADAAERRGEVGARKPDQRRSRRRDIALERLFLDDPGRGDALRPGGGNRRSHLAVLRRNQVLRLRWAAYRSTDRPMASPFLCGTSAWRFLRRCRMG
jgi:hypothetical protein